MFLKERFLTIKNYSLPKNRHDINQFQEKGMLFLVYDQRKSFRSSTPPATVIVLLFPIFRNGCCVGRVGLRGGGYTNVERRTNATTNRAHFDSLSEFRPLRHNGRVPCRVVALGVQLPVVAQRQGDAVQLQQVAEAHSGAALVTLCPGGESQVRLEQFVAALHAVAQKGVQRSPPLQLLRHVQRPDMAPDGGLRPKLCQRMPQPDGSRGKLLH